MINVYWLVPCSIVSASIGFLFYTMLTVGEEADKWMQGKGVPCSFVSCGESCESLEKCNRLNKRNHDQTIKGTNKGLRGLTRD